MLFVVSKPMQFIQGRPPSITANYYTVKTSMHQGDFKNIFQKVFCIPMFLQTFIRFVLDSVLDEYPKYDDNNGFRC